MTEADESRHQFQVNLGETALPELLHTVYTHRVPGRISARHGDVVKEVFVRNGAVIQATSTDREDSLGVYLLKEGALTRAQFESTMKNRAESGRKYGELLIEGDLVTPGELYDAIQAHIRSIVWSLFSWHEGQVTFDIGEFEDRGMIRIHLPLRQVILQGVKRAPDAKRLVARLGRKETAFEPHWTPEDLVEVAIDREELALLRLVDGRRNLYELCTSGPYAPAENARILYAFHVLRLIKRASRERSSGSVRIRMPSKS